MHYSEPECLNGPLESLRIPETTLTSNTSCNIEVLKPVSVPIIHQKGSQNSLKVVILLMMAHGSKGCRWKSAKESIDEAEPREFPAWSFQLSSSGGVVGSVTFSQQRCVTILTAYSPESSLGVQCFYWGSISQIWLSTHVATFFSRPPRSQTGTLWPKTFHHKLYC